MLDAGRDSPLLRLSLGQACFDNQDWAEAESHLQAALAQQENYSAAWQLLGKTQASAGKTASALSTYATGILQARQNGDTQAEKVMMVLHKRLLKTSDSTRS